MIDKRIVLETSNEGHGTSQWDDDSGLNLSGTALLSITGRGDRLRMDVLLAYLN